MQIEKHESAKNTSTMRKENTRKVRDNIEIENTKKLWFIGENGMNKKNHSHYVNAIDCAR